MKGSALILILMFVGCFYDEQPQPKLGDKWKDRPTSFDTWLNPHEFTIGRFKLGREFIAECDSLNRAIKTEYMDGKVYRMRDARAYFPDSARYADSLCVCRIEDREYQSDRLDSRSKVYNIIPFATLRRFYLKSSR